MAADCPPEKKSMGWFPIVSSSLGACIIALTVSGIITVSRMGEKLDAHAKQVSHEGAVTHREFNQRFSDFQDSTNQRFSNLERQASEILRLLGR